MDITQYPQLNPPQRLLMGPGPINADPRVLRAMSSQLLGQYDPAMTHYMNEVMALVFMHQGRVWEQGDSKTLFAQPQTPELKQFISSVRL